MVSSAGSPCITLNYNPKVYSPFSISVYNLSPTIDYDFLRLIIILKIETIVNYLNNINY